MPPLKKSIYIFATLFLLAFLSACTPTPPPLAEYGTPVTLALGETAQFQDSAVTLTFAEVLRDERCPSEVECEFHGPVLVRIVFEAPGVGSINLEMNPEPGLAAIGQGETTQGVAGLLVTLMSVDPYPELPEDRQDFSNYKATLLLAPDPAAP